MVIRRMGRCRRAVCTIHEEALWETAAEPESRRLESRGAVRERETIRYETRRYETRGDRKRLLVRV